MKKLIILALLIAAIVTPIKAATVSWNLATTSTILNNMMGAPKNVTVNGKVIAMDFSSTGVADIIQSTNGVDWSYTTRNASIGGVKIRAFSNVNNAVVSAGTIYVFGGQTPWDNNDVFESSDDGVTWTKHGDSAINFDVTDSFVATHGSFFMLHKTGASSYAYLESTDGLTWSSNGTFSQVGSIPTLLYVPSIDKLIFLYTDSVSGLVNVASAPRVFSSPMVETAFTSIPVRTVYGSVVYNNRIYFIGGFGSTAALNDVWYINPADIGSLTDASFIQDASIGIAAQDKRYALMPVTKGNAMIVFGGITIYPGRVWYTQPLVPTATVTRTNTPKPVATTTFSVTPSITATVTSTNTAVNTATRTITRTSTPLNTITATATRTITLTSTATFPSPTVTATATITLTWTLTQTYSPTPAVTATPIATTYLKFLHYQECVTCGNCGFTLEWNAIPTLVGNNFYRVYYTGAYAYYEDVYPNQSESASLGRMVYTLQNLQWDKTYEIKVASFYPDEPFSSTSNAIYISCLETPTPNP